MHPHDLMNGSLCHLQLQQDILHLLVWLEDPQAVIVKLDVLITSPDFVAIVLEDILEMVVFVLKKVNETKADNDLVYLT